MPLRYLRAFLLAAILLPLVHIWAQHPAFKSGNDPWWKHAVIYEIYPRSFQDSNGDGIGDLNGITSRLDYLRDLGVDAIWIAPIFPSPQKDFGYDISDYENIDPQYGTLADFDRLVREAGKRHIRVLLDMVLNHTSDQHPWFRESSSSRDNPKADWYVWNDGRLLTKEVPAYEQKVAHDGMAPPNNWESLFGGSAWQWEEARRQFYYHRFLIQQPDLNWRNPQVEKAMFDTMRFWLDRGVAGFRLDAITAMFEDPELRDDPTTGGTNLQGDPQLKYIHTDNLSEVHDVLRRMRRMVDAYPGDRVLVGETYLPNTLELDKWYGGSAHNELHLPMDMLIGFGPDARLDAVRFRKYLSEVETQVHGSQPLLVFDNHDNPRSFDRLGDGQHNREIAGILATVLLASRSTPLLYYGQEIGMATTPPKRIEDVVDPVGRVRWPRNKGRDGERTPMQWDSSNPQAGFSANAKTWLPVPPLYREVNVRQQEADPTSLLNWYKRLIALRRNEDALRDGGMVMLNDDDLNVLSWLRNSAAGAPVVIAVNMSATAQTVRLRLDAAGLHANTARTLAADSGAPEGLQKLDALTLPPFSSWIGELVNARGSSVAAQAPPAQHRSRSSTVSAQSVHQQQH